MIDTLLTHLRSVAPDVANVPILQPVDPFLETAGEDLRRRIFITQTTSGEQQCLRPEFTIPICLHHSPSKVARYAYGGTVFRQERQGADEFLQVGLEDLGSADKVATDARCISDMVETLALAGVPRPSIVLGDQQLFGVVVNSLELPDPVAHRLVRNFGSPDQLENLLIELTRHKTPQNSDGTVEELARAGDEPALVNHIEKLMTDANLPAKAGRSSADIAARMIAKVKEGYFQLDERRAEVLRQFLALEAPLAGSTEALDDFAKQSGVLFGIAGKDFKNRIEALVVCGVDLQLITYKASFGRNLEYYTGVLFEARSDAEVVAGGGRYDDLCSLLGAGEPVPAVGFSISLDRVEKTK